VDLPDISSYPIVDFVLRTRLAVDEETPNIEGDRNIRKTLKDRRLVVIKAHNGNRQHTGSPKKLGFTNVAGFPRYGTSTAEIALGRSRTA